jgi:hypothetical protein
VRTERGTDCLHGATPGRQTLHRRGFDQLIEDGIGQISNESRAEHDSRQESATTHDNCDAQTGHDSDPP